MPEIPMNESSDVEGISMREGQVPHLKTSLPLPFQDESPSRIFLDRFDVFQDIIVHFGDKNPANDCEYQYHLRSFWGHLSKHSRCQSSSMNGAGLCSYFRAPKQVKFSLLVSNSNKYSGIGNVSSIQIEPILSRAGQ